MSTCSVCGGQLEALGEIDGREHFKCSACGVRYMLSIASKIREAIDRERAHAEKRSSR